MPHTTLYHTPHYHTPHYITHHTTPHTTLDHTIPHTTLHHTTSHTTLYLTPHYTANRENHAPYKEHHVYLNHSHTSKPPPPPPTSSCFIAPSPTPSSSRNPPLCRPSAQLSVFSSHSISIKPLKISSWFKSLLFSLRDIGGISPQLNT